MAGPCIACERESARESERELLVSWSAERIVQLFLIAAEMFDREIIAICIIMALDWHGGEEKKEKRDD